MKVLVGFDGSKVAGDAIKLARNYAKAFSADIELVTTMDRGTEDSVQKIREAEKDLEYAEGLFEKDTIPCRTHLLIRGLSPGEGIVQFAKENNIDLIIVGVRRRSKVGKILLGSTAQYVILKASCPVLTVK